MSDLCWIEVDAGRLADNIAGFRRLVGPEVLLAPAVKANAYGHGLVEAARAFLGGGADWLCVNSTFEAERLRAAHVDAPLYLLGPLAPGRADAEAALATGCRVVVPNVATLDALAAAASADRPARVHLKIETGTQRLGLEPQQALALALRVGDLPHVQVEGACSHFADVEDTTDHAFAQSQRDRFDAFVDAAGQAGVEFPMRHFSNSAATLLWQEVWYEMVRLGISAYGMWPSKETQVSAAAQKRNEAIRLAPALTWKTRIHQLRIAPAGAFVGYGRTYRCHQDTRLAVLPVGYYDGYDRGLSNAAHVLVRGHRAPVRGRVCMNMTIVDVTHVQGVSEGDEVVLLGRQGEEEITAARMAQWAGTIHYEVTTRIRQGLPRRVV